MLLRTKDQGANIHNLNYTDITNLSTEINADSDLPATAWGHKIQESVDKYNWSSLIGKDYKNVIQLHKFDNPPIVNPVDLATSKPTVLVRSEYNDGGGLIDLVELKYVPLSSLSAIPNDTDIS